MASALRLDAVQVGWGVGGLHDPTDTRIFSSLTAARHTGPRRYHMGCTKSYSGVVLRILWWKTQTQSQSLQ